MPSRRSSVPPKKWVRASEEMVRLYHHLSESLPEAETRQMFGYPCSFLNGQMFAGLHGDGMILRLPEWERAQFLTLEGAKRFEPMPGRPMKEYVVVPPAMLANEALLISWLNKALEYARTLPPKIKR